MSFPHTWECLSCQRHLFCNLCYSLSHTRGSVSQKRLEMWCSLRRLSHTRGSVSVSTMPDSSKTSCLSHIRGSVFKSKGIPLLFYFKIIYDNPQKFSFKNFAVKKCTYLTRNLQKFAPAR